MASLQETQGPGETYHLAFAAMGAALGLHLLGYAMQQTRISIFALLLFSGGVLLLGGGRRWARAALFPLGFLLLAVPVGFLQPLGFYLRLAVSASAEHLLHVLGSDVVRNGTQLFDAQGRYHYEVAAACSGVRSLVVLFGLSLLIGYVRLNRFGSRLILLALTVPAAFLGNFLRIVTIVLVGQVFGQSAGERVHDGSGFLVFGVVLAGLLLALRFFPEEASPEAVSPALDKNDFGLKRTPMKGHSTSALWPLTVAILALMLGVGAAARRLDARPPQITAGIRLSDNGVDPVPLPEFIGTEWIGQRVEVTEAEREVLPPDTGYSRRNYVAVEDRSRQVFVSIVLSGLDRTSIHRPELCIIGQGWNIVQRAERTLKLGVADELSVTLLRLQREITGRSGERLSSSCWLAYWFVGRSTTIASHTEMIWRSSLDRLLHFRADRWAYLVAQTPATASETADLQRMEEVVSEVWPTIKAPSGKVLPSR